MRAGQPLFRIDPRELRASYAQTKAALTRAHATAANARAVVDRYRPLVDENAISGQEYDAALAAAREAEANVAQIRAQLDAASLQLGYTTVRAPISGPCGPCTGDRGCARQPGRGHADDAYRTDFARLCRASPRRRARCCKLRRAIAAGEVELDENDRVEVRLTFCRRDGIPRARLYRLPRFLGRPADRDGRTARRISQSRRACCCPANSSARRSTRAQIAERLTVPQRAVSLTEDGGTVFVVNGEGRRRCGRSSWARWSTATGSSKAG